MLLSYAIMITSIPTQVVSAQIIGNNGLSGINIPNTTGSSLEGDSRLTYTTDAKGLVDGLKSRGMEILDFTIRSVMGYYTNGIEYSRGYEVRQWLITHNDIESYVILDDDTFEDWFCLKDRWVKTDFYGDGLNKECVNNAIGVLNNKR